MNDQLLIYARKYAEKNFYIIPVSINKAPLTKNGFHDASNDLDQIDCWFRKYNNIKGIGIVTGRINNLCVFDIDFRNSGAESLQLLLEKYPQLSCGCVSQTGNGLHYFFQYLDGSKSINGILPGIDFKSDNGYVIAPPSYHKNGNQYSWLKGGEYFYGIR